MKTGAMTVTTLQLFQILKEKPGEYQAETLVTYVDTKVHNEFEEHKEHIATKEDIAFLKSDIASFKGDFDAKFAKLDTKMTTLFWMFGILITANELPEFNHTFLDVMHQPLEDCIITISGQNLL